MSECHVTDAQCRIDHRCVSCMHVKYCERKSDECSFKVGSTCYWQPIEKKGQTETMHPDENPFENEVPQPHELKFPFTLTCPACGQKISGVDYIGGAVHLPSNANLARYACGTLYTKKNNKIYVQGEQSDKCKYLHLLAKVKEHLPKLHAEIVGAE